MAKHWPTIACLTEHVSRRQSGAKTHNHMSIKVFVWNFVRHTFVFCIRSVSMARRNKNQRRKLFCWLFEKWVTDWLACWVHSWLLAGTCLLRLSFPFAGLRSAAFFRLLLCMFEGREEIMVYVIASKWFITTKWCRSWLKIGIDWKMGYVILSILFPISIALNGWYTNVNVESPLHGEPFWCLELQINAGKIPTNQLADPNSLPCRFHIKSVALDCCCTRNNSGASMNGTYGLATTDIMPKI